MTSTTIPELPRGCGSWIVSTPDGRAVELYKRANVSKAADAGWRVETAVDYLARLNRQIAEAARAGGGE